MFDKIRKVINRNTPSMCSWVSLALIYFMDVLKGRQEFRDRMSCKSLEWLRLYQVEGEEVFLAMGIDALEVSRNPELFMRLEASE